MNGRFLLDTNIIIMFWVSKYGHPSGNFKKVEKYMPTLAYRRSLPLGDLYLALSTLPISVYDVDFYKDTLKKAEKLIGERDPDDIHLLGLALKLSCPIWSNDRDFDDVGITIYSTLAFIRKH